VNSPPARKGSPQQVVAPGQTRQTKLILSLDGDGIRGLSSVLLVESLVNAICKQLNRRVDPYQIFDLIGGVSTTGFLAILIGRLRMRVHQARNAYLAIAKPMFEDKLTFFASLDPHRQLDPYPGPTLEATIKDLVMRECGTLDETFLDTREDSTNV
jgi:calcium-independent phospholipase A2-gamma